MELSPDIQASYVLIIDSILAASDLNTISSKRIREGLQRAVDYDITPHKEPIKKLIMERFDQFAAERNQSATDPATDIKPDPSEAAPSSPISAASSSKKRKSPGFEPSDLGKSPISAPAKKKVKVLDADAAFAAKLQAEENSRARPTRNGVTRKAAPTKKKKTPKKKTAARINASDDSELELSDGAVGAKKEVNRNSGFHKLLTPSSTLATLLDFEVGETQISRPQCVSRIWKYIKSHDLQDPADKRWIQCDDAMRAVFKCDRIHMMTMNKTLSQNLYAADE